MWNFISQTKYNFVTRMPTQETEIAIMLEALYPLLLPPWPPKGNHHPDF